LDPATAAGLGLSIAGILGAVFGNVERMHKVYNAAQEIPRQTPWVLDLYKTMKRRLGEHPEQHYIVAELRDEVELLADGIAAHADE
jgi:hypothetical protein